ncbi:MAG: HDOD domain-containing protein [Deltaproteobacteria bacterium]|nr:HDOD domain-containing protein [Deltaproteobacteria bacterium]MBW1932925.1 HDOD domain-containing protein [Deltaproteobacteria bacterium]MBW1938385.1 HDOD domain-containing protein [Deltaproteobacteria bacterium]MBW1964518.1 HDOD domain-containing protein [Deltaproteobacteria bacterium]MBW2079971.1 HDOD domain-containing protein [Deltaproteobacteria bacterium]
MKTGHSVVTESLGHNSVNLVDLSIQRRRKEIISRLEFLPPLPTAAHEVLSIIADDPKDIIMLEQTIRHDPALASQLLKVANCALYAPLSVIDTVQRAIVYLGFSRVRNIALSLSIFGLFKSKNAIKGINQKDFWTHAIATATVTRMLALELYEDNTEVCFTAGLLHDIGRIAISACFPEEWADIVKAVEEEDCSLLIAEHKVGLPHSLIGAWLAKSWGLPKIYERTIATHHLPVKHPKATHMGALVQLADHMCHKIGMGLFSAPRIQRQVLIAYLGLSEDVVDELEEQLVELEGIATTITDVIG